MNQLKLLNFHKMIANFANNLVGAFVSLIIFQATGSMTYAIVYLVANNICRLLFGLLLKNYYGKYPQLFLLLRIIPITLYNLSIFLLDYNLVWGVILICIFRSFDWALANVSKEVIFNYSSLTSSKKAGKSSIGVTRLFEQAGTIIALIVGGYLLDFNQTLVLILSLIIYAISVIPLVMFYIKSRHQKTFNKDATSNAVTTLSKKNEELHNESKRLTKKLLLNYFIVYFSFAFVDLLSTTYNLYIFAQQGEFATAGILSAVFNTFYAIGFYVAGIVNEKYDTTKFVSLCCVIIAAGVIAMPFIPIDTMLILICVIYGLIAFCNTFISLFVLDRMLLKSRIMACSNKALILRESACVTAYIIGYSCGFFGLLGIFIATTVTMASSAFIIPSSEERTRQNLVDYLQNNEKINSRAPKTKAKRIEEKHRLEEKKALSSSETKTKQTVETPKTTETKTTKSTTSKEKVEPKKTEPKEPQPKTKTETKK